MNSLNYKLILLGLLCLNILTNCKKQQHVELEIETSNKDPHEPDAIVSKDGSGNYTSVQSAVNAAPDYSTKPLIIYVKNGEYTEVITVPKSKNALIFKGESADSTLITFDNYSSGSNPKGSSSVYIPASIFTAENITFETVLN